MILARVIGEVVSSHKRPQFEGAKLLLVQPDVLPGMTPTTAMLAIDAAGAGVGDRVLYVVEGKSAGEALGRKGAPVDAAIIGIVDAVTEG